MRCPVDDAQLREVTRRGVKIDLCSECRGIWLDRGELEHLLEAAGADDEADPRAASDSRAPRPLLEEQRRSEPRYDERASYDERRRRDDDDRRYPKKKKRSWLSEILEFGE